MMKKTYSKKYKNIKISLKYKQNEDESFNNDKMNKRWLSSEWICQSWIKWEHKKHEDE